MCIRDREIGVVDIELHRLKEVLNCLLLSTVTIDEVLACATKNDLAGYRDFRILLEAYRALLFVLVVENDSHARFGNSSLSALIYEILLSRQLLVSWMRYRFVPEGSARGLWSCW